MSGLARKNVSKIMPYIAGKPIEETKRELGLEKVIKLASNENPLGPSPLAKAAIIKCVNQINRYPDSQSFYLREKLAASLGLNRECLVLGNGSDELIDVIIKAFVEPDEFILTAQTTFLEYEIIAQVFGRRIKKVPLKNFKYDLKAMAKCVTDKCKLIFIANPNNPTGTYVNKDEVREFLRGLPDSAVVVFDEAYDTFIDVKDYPDTLKYLKDKNVIILKTFSKGYGLAGLRIGYAIAKPEIAKYMQRVRQPFNINIMAQAAALAALDDKNFLNHSRKVVLEGKKFLYREISRLGLKYVPSAANFILVDLAGDGLKVFKALLKSGVIVRDMDQYGLKNFIRVTVGTESENKLFIKALSKIIK